MKSSDMIIAGADCNGCRFLKEINRSKIHCDARDKEYYYGQYVPCDDREEVKKK